MIKLRSFLFLIDTAKLKTSLEESVGPAPIFSCFPTCLYCSPVESLGKILSLLKSVEMDFIYFTEAMISCWRRAFFGNFEKLSLEPPSQTQKPWELSTAMFLHVFICYFCKKKLSRWWFLNAFPCTSLEHKSDVFSFLLYI